MTFKQAKKKLKKVADTEYHKIKYELGEHTDGQMMAECSLYIHERGWHSATTWDLAFSSLETVKPDLTEAP